MAVLQMQQISICALKKSRKQILETLQRRGVVEIADLPPEDSIFQPADAAEEKSDAERKITLANQALDVLGQYAPLKGSMMDMFAGREALSEEEFARRSDECEQTLETARQLLSHAKAIAEGKAEEQKLLAQLDALSPWMGLEVPLLFSGTRTTAAFIGSFPEELSLEAIYQRLAELAPELEAVNIDLISTSSDMTCIFLLVPRKDSEKAEDALRAMGFTRPAAPSKLSPVEQKKQLEQQLSQVGQAVQNAEQAIGQLADQRQALQFLADYQTMRQEKYEAIGHLSQSRRTFLLRGYIAAKDAPALVSELNASFDAAVELSDPDAQADVPARLQNSSFATPVESVLESYGLPLQGEIDPTPIMACFYYFLFGLMFSDFGYGALLALGTGLLLLKCKNMESGLRNMIKMFFFCGISTAAWGIIFSSYFGDVVNVVSRTFLGQEVSIPALWFVPLDNPMKLLVFSMAIGVVHLFTGLGIQLYQHLKHGDFKSALYKVIFWYMLVGGLILFGLSTDMLVSVLQLSFKLPAAVGSIFGWIAAIGAVGIVLTNGDSANPAVRFAQGLYELYNVTGYLSDILSYSRLLALGLATGVVGSVINQMGAMGGNGIPGIILFVLVFLVGHTLNFGIELLGAYVHCNRLQFVEFFGKFYEGGRRKFQPFAVHTKYYKFKEDTNHG
ncbi:MAG: V-type ATP synthase subunit I [Anaerotruncus sp.]|nr:V-type ATP synthase subunit I [Anaerotruncus sp.]